MIRATKDGAVERAIAQRAAGVRADAVDCVRACLPTLLTATSVVAHFHVDRGSPEWQQIQRTCLTYESQRAFLFFVPMRALENGHYFRLQGGADARLPW